MRIAIMGKGGSGKTTIAAGFVRHLSRRTTPVLAVDGDVNAHLGGALFMDQRQLHDRTDDIKHWLEPELSKCAPILGVTPPSDTSRFITISNDDAFLNQFASWDAQRNIALLTVGTYEANDAATACYHSMLQCAEIAMHRTLDTEHDWVVSDSTAGIDSIGTSMHFASDINVFVVEPTLKSLSVFEDFRRVTAGMGITTVAVGNKIEDDNDRKFIVDAVGADAVIGFAMRSNAIRELEQGNDAAFDAFVSDNIELWTAIDVCAHTGPRDWTRYLERLRCSYDDNCESWYNKYYSTDLRDKVDRDFTYDSVLTS